MDVLTRVRELRTQVKAASDSQEPTQITYTHNDRQDIRAPSEARTLGYQTSYTEAFEREGGGLSTPINNLAKHERNHNTADGSPAPSSATEWMIVRPNHEDASYKVIADASPGTMLPFAERKAVRFILPRLEPAQPRRSFEQQQAVMIRPHRLHGPSYSSHTPGAPLLLDNLPRPFDSVVPLMQLDGKLSIRSRPSPRT